MAAVSTDVPALSIPVRYACEHVSLAIYTRSRDGSRAVAREIADLIRARQREGRQVVLGLATGSTPVGVYAELVRLHREEGLTFGNVVTFNLDEYYPLPASHPQSYHRYMQAHLFDHIAVPEILRREIDRDTDLARPSDAFGAGRVEHEPADR